ncbi:uncharacterized protein EV422DRAFT_289993 [Fimicolochytrium jonesii]|uniref:uncharacterized protein n=1 Tax=Fimicolochytrium jonesii TaxID=1396493 RepID=UPI0022FDEB34|nr:uncharacterized protein EV422DRAFT_289993 [Fimicolochytrium jonesii]KAI8816375.1 hypothetical protein EV422DRAFT_289993 [Fimicolochytrium jonesii]
MHDCTSDAEQTADFIHSKYAYQRTKVSFGKDGCTADVNVQEDLYTFQSDDGRWGGNNGSTLTASILANRHNLSWETKDGVQTANYFGSVTQSSTILLGTDDEHRDVYVPFGAMLPMVHPNDLVLGGWDINSATLAEAKLSFAVF